jgi:uncharacterized membrane protein YeaQ/YmgE (transglycosylase-associated protein family)
VNGGLSTIFCGIVGACVCALITGLKRALDLNGRRGIKAKKLTGRCERERKNSFVLPTTIC